MSSIKSLKSNNGPEGIIEWQYDSKQIKLSVTSLHQAMVFEDVGLVLTLTGVGDFPITLEAHKATGEVLFSVHAPEGFVFSYLSNHPDLSIAVVASSVGDKIDGWYDWYFGVNPKTGELIRHCPAY